MKSKIQTSQSAIDMRSKPEKNYKDLARFLEEKRRHLSFLLWLSFGNKRLAWILQSKSIRWSNNLCVVHKEIYRISKAWLLSQPVFFSQPLLSEIVWDHWLPSSRLIFPFDTITAHSCLIHQPLGYIFLWGNFGNDIHMQAIFKSPDWYIMNF